MHIDKCSEAHFKFSVHLGCKKNTTGTSDYQSAQPADKINVITGEEEMGRGGGGGGSVRWGIWLKEEGGKTKQKRVTSPDPSLLLLVLGENAKKKAFLNVTFDGKTTFAKKKKKN